MSNPILEKKPRLLFLFSDTGGGHRSAAEAIIEALHLEYGEGIDTEMVDIFKEYAPPPLNLMPELYPEMVKIPQAWGLGYRLSNGRRRARLIYASAWPVVRKAIRNLVARHPAELIVSVHPLASTPTLRALGPRRPPFTIVVTDMVTTHALWYDRRADLCIVPTEEARRRGIMAGVRPENTRVVGLPVADRFCQPPADLQAARLEVRQHYGWPSDRPLILLVGGGEGMGPLEQAAQAIAAACPQAAQVVICGRNQGLKERLAAARWPIPTFLYGFVREMPAFMRAADVLVTKAGPGTICEAFISGLPMLLYSRLPGQEDGNVTYVVSEGAGLWTPHAGDIAAALKGWLEHPELRQQAAENSLRLARPQAAREIARLLAEQLSSAPLSRIYPK